MEQNKPENNKEKKSIWKFMDEGFGLVSKVIVIVGFTGAACVLSTFPEESIQVQKGSNLSEIATQYGIPQSKLIKRNKLENPDYIQAGQDLILYNQGLPGMFQRIADRN